MPKILAKLKPSKSDAHLIDVQGSSITVTFGPSSPMWEKLSELPSFRAENFLSPELKCAAQNLDDALANSPNEYTQAKKEHETTVQTILLRANARFGAEAVRQALQNLGFSELVHLK